MQKGPSSFAHIVGAHHTARLSQSHAKPATKRANSNFIVHRSWARNYRLHEDAKTSSSIPERLPNPQISGAPNSHNATAVPTTVAAFDGRRHNTAQDHSAKNLRSVEGDKALARPDDLSPYSYKAQKSKSPSQPIHPRKQQHNTRNKNSNPRAAIRYVGGQRKKPGLAVQANSSFTPDTQEHTLNASSNMSAPKSTAPYDRFQSFDIEEIVSGDDLQASPPKHL